MKLMLFILFITLSFGLYAQSDTLNQKDSLGRKQGHWIFYGKDQPQKGYPLEGKIAEGEYLNDRRNGEWVMYYKDGETPKIKGFFKHGRPDGVFVKYYRNGKIKEQGTFNKMRYIDTLKRYNEEGVLIYVGIYNKGGKEHGAVRYFHHNGKPDLVKTFNNGVSVDTTKRFSFNGDLIELIIYDSRGIEIKNFSKPQVIRDSTGKEIYRIVEPPVNYDALNNKSKDTLKGNDKDGYNKIPDGNHDKPRMEGEFKNGRLWNGKLYIYDDDGLLLKIEIYKDGKYHSDGQL